MLALAGEKKWNSIADSMESSGTVVSLRSVFDHGPLNVIAPQTNS